MTSFTSCQQRTAGAFCGIGSPSDPCVDTTRTITVNGSPDAPEMGGRELTIDAAYVRERLEPILQDQDLSRFIL